MLAQVIRGAIVKHARIIIYRCQCAIFEFPYFSCRHRVRRCTCSCKLDVQDLIELQVPLRKQQGRRKQEKGKDKNFHRNYLWNDVEFDTREIKIIRAVNGRKF